MSWVQVLQNLRLHTVTHDFWHLLQKCQHLTSYTIYRLYINCMKRKFRQAWQRIACCIISALTETPLTPCLNIYWSKTASWSFWFLRSKLGEWKASSTRMEVMEWALGSLRSKKPTRQAIETVIVREDLTDSVKEIFGMDLYPIAKLCSSSIQWVCRMTHVFTYKGKNVSQHHSCLLLWRLQQLVFLKFNYPVLNFEGEQSENMFVSASYLNLCWWVRAKCCSVTRRKQLDSYPIYLTVSSESFKNLHLNTSTDPVCASQEMLESSVTSNQNFMLEIIQLHQKLCSSCWNKKWWGRVKDLFVKHLDIS